MGNGNSWWWRLVQGILAIVLGIYLLIGADAAAGNFALVAGIYILVASIIELLRGTGQYSRYRAVVGLVVGALILLLRFVDIFGTTFDFTLFAIGIILVGAMGLYGELFARSGRDFEWGPVLINALLVLWGVMIFYFRAEERDLQAASGWILIGIGVIVTIWGYAARGQDSKETVPEPIVPKPLPPTDVEEEKSDKPGSADS